MRSGHPRGLLVLLAILSGCAGDDTTVPPKLVPTLLIVNKSQFQLQQVMLHTRVDNYLGKPNLLAAPLALEGELLAPNVTPGTWFVTVVREKVAHGALIAITTGSGLALELDGTYRLWVFDESFRLWPPTSTPDGRRDLGPGRKDAPDDQGGSKGWLDSAPPDQPHDQPRPVEAGGG